MLNKNSQIRSILLIICIFCSTKKKSFSFLIRRSCERTRTKRLGVSCVNDSAVFLSRRLTAGLRRRATDFDVIWFEFKGVI